MNKKIKNRRLYCLLAVVLLITLTIPSTLGSVLGKYVKEFEFQTGFVSENTFSVTYYVVVDGVPTVFDAYTYIDGQTHTHTHTTVNATNQAGQTLQSFLPEGAVFKGWDDMVGGDITATEFTKDTLLFADYEVEEQVVTHTITFMDARNTLISMLTYEPGQYTKAQVYELFPEVEQTTAEGYVFAYWGVTIEGGTSYTRWEDFSWPTDVDLIIRPYYDDPENHIGFLPVDTDGNGTTEYYKVIPVDELHDVVTIPGTYMGLPVKEIEKLYEGSTGNMADNVKEISLGEGIERINAYALSATPSLTTVYLPNTLTYMGTNAFAINSGHEAKVIHIVYNGTFEEWKNLINASHNKWGMALASGTTVECTDYILTYGKDCKSYSAVKK